MVLKQFEVTTDRSYYSHASHPLTMINLENPRENKSNSMISHLSVQEKVVVRWKHRVIDLRDVLFATPNTVQENVRSSITRKDYTRRSVIYSR